MASLFAALTVAVGGLDAQSSALGNISDNLSNAQTTGFKSIGTNFEDLVTQSNANINDPGGVRATPEYQNDVQGNLTQSATATNLAISGEGFFQVEPATQNSNGSTTFSGNVAYTRQGDFTLDKDGFIVNSSGYYLMGYGINTDGSVNTSTTAPIEVSALLNDPVPSTSATYDANLPSSAATNFASTPSTVQLFDALGNTHDMSFTWTKTGTNTWDLNVSVAGGAGTNTSGNTNLDYTTTIPFTFNSSGSDVGTIGHISSSASGGSGGAYTVVDNSNAAVDAAQVSFHLNFGGGSPAGFGAGSQVMTLNFGSYNEPNGLTQFAGTDVSVTSFSQNGLPQGSFSNLSIDSNGFVSLNYNNGSLKTIAQIPIVQFFAQDQLQRVSGGAYEATLASGSPRVGPAGTAGAGTIVGSSLESSNVDIATQFTDMIQAQQIYSANAKTITTIDAMLNTIINTVQ